MSKGHVLPSNVKYFMSKCPSSIRPYTSIYCIVRCNECVYSYALALYTCLATVACVIVYSYAFFTVACVIVYSYAFYTTVVCVNRPYTSILYS